MIELDDIKREVDEKGAAERSWELLRVNIYPGVPHTTAAKKLGKWAKENGLEIEFDAKKATAGKQVIEIIRVLFTPR